MNFKQLAAELGLEQDEFSELLAIFIETSEADLVKIQEGIDDGDAGRVADAAHSIKGASANLGFMDMSSEAKSLEQRARDNSLEDSVDTVNKIKEQLAMIAKAMEG
jgi:histidine phosphotransfer protein HptB